jgi:hypothetical protein
MLKHYSFIGKIFFPQEERSVDRAPGKKILPAMQHSSGVQYIAACNCGGRQANRYSTSLLLVH